MDYRGIEEVKKKYSRVNAYFWRPIRTRDYGELGFTATEAGAEALLRVGALVVEIQSQGFELALPGVGQEDVDVIGGGLDWFAESVVLAYREGVSRLALTVEGRSLRVELCEANLDLWEDLVGRVLAGEADRCVHVLIDGEAGSLWYWACFGHLWKAKDPERAFPE